MRGLLNVSMSRLVHPGSSLCGVTAAIAYLTSIEGAVLHLRLNAVIHSLTAVQERRSGQGPPLSGAGDTANGRDTSSGRRLGPPQ